ncbi:MAG: vitamin B12-dependent ribonucleotide reductase [Candidatus Kerfeldbacteria bacterium]|nr:vitamin B12-dependent ribonucleotide reductase [Candidatus Kerfeldbacteria bacterium]
MSDHELTQVEREAIMETVEPKLTDAALAVVRKRHLRHDEQGNITETPQQMFLRVAEHMAKADLLYDENADLVGTTQTFYEMMGRMEFLPGSRILYEAGTHHNGALASCFVLPVEDNLQKIFQTLQDAAVVQQHNGGCGYNFSKIRPKSDVVRGVPNVSAGPVHFLETFSTALSQVMQGSKRPGGNMGVLNVDHPDIEEFITFKSEQSSYANFNVSVGVTDAFMERVREDTDHPLVNPRTGEVVKTIRARKLFNMIVENAWRTGDPGMMFLDRIEEQNPTPAIGVMDATNPCGEQPLLPYESCNLGSLILSEHVTKDGKVDWEKLRSTMRKAVHFLDNMLDVNQFPLPQIEQMVRYGNRKIGIGIAGFAHMLYKLGIPYNSDEAIELAEEIQRVLNEEGHAASGTLAESRGVFPNWSKSVFAAQNKKMRNATVTTIAPTGTLAMVPQTSSGVEPVFSLVTARKSFYEDTRNRNGGGKTLVYADKVFEEIARARGFWSEELMERLAEAGSIQEFSEIPEDVRRVFVTTHDIGYEWHVKIQAAFQKHCDNAVSKTINFPEFATVEDVRRAYIMAYELGCKGITIYRDGSKQFQVLNKGSKAHTTQQEVPTDLSTAVEKISESAFDVKMMHTEETSVPAEAEFDVELTPNALTVLTKRALRKSAEGLPIETPDELFRRIARFIASAEEQYGADDTTVKKWEDRFYEMMANLEFISGQALRNSGEEGLTLSACLVLPIEDSIESILQTLNENVIAHKSTIGTGMNLSKLRSSFVSVSSSGETAAGPVKFLKAINAAQGTIRTKGGRKQGSMAILNVDHPDIEEFIQAKDTLGQIDHFNISVGATDAFMQAVTDDADWELVDPHTHEVVKTVRARALFRQVADHAWRSGDPGMIFIDAMDRNNPTPSLGKLDATNPCGEQPLLPYETCNLGSIVLSRMVRETAEKGIYTIDWEKLKDRVEAGVRFLDDTIDKNIFPLERITEMTLANRRIGLGVMGFADMLVKLRIPYDSKEATNVAEDIMSFVQKHAHDASEQIALEKGSFPNFEKSIWAENRRAMRNSAVTTIAPTGYTSIVANCSSGVEPIYALAFKRTNSMNDHDLFEVVSVFEEVAKQEGFYSEELMKKIIEHGSCQGLSEVPKNWQKVFLTAHEVSPEAHIRVQAAFQKHCDNAVSKTINFPESASSEDIENVYMLAWKLECKGVTIFRDGSKEEQAMHVGNKSKERALQSAVVGVQGISPRPRPEVVSGSTYKVKTSYGNLFITINNDEEGNPFEIFAQIGKSGGVFQAKSEAICRLASLALRSGIEVSEVIKQLKGIRGPMPSWGKKGMILSIPDAIAQTLEAHLSKDQGQLELAYPTNGQHHVSDAGTTSTELESLSVATTSTDAEEELEPSESQDVQDTSAEKTSTLFEEQVVVTEVAESVQEKEVVKEKVLSRSIADMGFAPECPECSNVLEMGEGCMVCRVCGYSKCG